MSAFKRLNILGTGVTVLAAVILITGSVVLTNYMLNNMDRNMLLKQPKERQIIQVDTVYVTVTKEVECTKKHVEEPKAVVKPQPVVQPVQASVVVAQKDSTENWNK